MTSYSDCSLVLLNYARPENVSRILLGNLKLPWNDIVVIDHQEHGPLWDELPIDCKSDRVVVVAPNQNQMSYGRCTGSLIARKDIICTQDDDYFVKPAGWEKLFASHDIRDGCVSTLCMQGVLDESGIKPYASLGYGSVFDRRWMIWAWARLLDSEHACPLDVMQRKADKAWTTLWGKTRQVPAWTTEITRLMGSDWTLSETDKYSIHLMASHRRDSEIVLGAAMSARMSALSKYKQRPGNSSPID